MSTLEITSTSSGWAETIAEHLARGEQARVHFETPFMTPQEMADSIGISRPAIMRRIAEGQIATRRHGNRHRIMLSEVERFRAWYLHDIAEASADDVHAELFGSDE
ncbi:MAG: helix-turn-helix domain-containing protein [Micrococcales bacterium]|nr:helix-turn-helix domain-containing protein [Micrococcales bacterium]